MQGLYWICLYILSGAIKQQIGKQEKLIVCSQSCICTQDQQELACLENYSKEVQSKECLSENFNTDDLFKMKVRYQKGQLDFLNPDIISEALIKNGLSNAYWIDSEKRFASYSEYQLHKTRPVLVDNVPVTTITTFAPPAIPPTTPRSILSTFRSTSVKPEWRHIPGQFGWNSSEMVNFKLNLTKTVKLQSDKINKLDTNLNDVSKSVKQVSKGIEVVRERLNQNATSLLKAIKKTSTQQEKDIKKYVVDQFKILEKDNEKMRLGLIKEMKEISDKAQKTQRAFMTGLLMVHAFNDTVRLNATRRDIMNSQAIIQRSLNSQLEKCIKSAKPPAIVKSECNYRPLADSLQEFRQETGEKLEEFARNQSIDWNGDFKIQKSSIPGLHCLFDESFCTSLGNEFDIFLLAIFFTGILLMLLLLVVCCGFCCRCCRRRSYKKYQREPLEIVKRREATKRRRRFLFANPLRKLRSAKKDKKSLATNMEMTSLSQTRPVQRVSATSISTTATHLTNPSYIDPAQTERMADFIVSSILQAQRAREQANLPTIEEENSTVAAVHQQPADQDLYQQQQQLPHHQEQQPLLQQEHQQYQEQQQHQEQQQQHQEQQEQQEHQPEQEGAGQDGNAQEVDQQFVSEDHYENIDFAG